MSEDDWVEAREQHEQHAIHDALVEATLGHHTDSQRVMGVWPFNDEALMAEYQPYIYQSIFEQTIVLGANAPKFSMHYETCENGCHHRAYVVDEANDGRYFISEIPRTVLGGLEVSFTRIHPAVEMAEMRKRQAVLN